MTSYLARLVERAQGPDPAFAPDATAARNPEPELPDPFETIGEPIPLDEPRPAPRGDRGPLEADATAPGRGPAPLPEHQATLPPPAEQPYVEGYRPPGPAAEQLLSGEPPVPEIPVPLPPASAAAETAQRDSDLSRLLPPQERADAFMQQILPTWPPAAPPSDRPGPATLSTPEPPPPADRSPQEQPSIEPRRAVAEPLAPRVEPSPEPLADDTESPLPSPAEPVVSIGRLNVTVERPPPAIRETIVKRVVRVQESRGTRSDRSVRPRFGLAQS